MAEFGIHPYHRSDASVADLVLVHGLMGNSQDTWAGKDDKGQRTYWPDWIRERRPDVNIWLADYDSSLVAWLQPAMPLDQIGGSLLMHAKDQGLGTRPIHWVGHSMGGLIIKYLLCEAREKADPDWRRIGEVPTAITFLGTPHHGSEVAKWEQYFGPLLTAADLATTGGMTTGLLGLAKSVLGRARNADIDSHVRQLRAHAKPLGDLNDAFAQWLGAASRAGNLLPVRNYYETIPVYKKVMVVPKPSAQWPNALIEEGAAAANHFDICKFSSAENALFNSIIVSLDGLSSRNPARIGSQTVVAPAASAPPARVLDHAQQNAPEHGPVKDSVRPIASQIVLVEKSPSNQPAGVGVHDEQNLGASSGHEVDPHASAEAREMGGGVFISYAANDLEWTAERVEDFARELDGLGVCVHLDVRYEASMKQLVAPADWRRWMDECLHTATNVICLCSERYARAWARDESLSGGCGVAFESARIERYLYDKKQNNRGRVLVVTVANLSNVIPDALRDACPQYVLGREKDDRFLRSHLSAGRVWKKETESNPGAPENPAASSEAEEVSDAKPSAGRSFDGLGGTIPLDRKMLSHQADHADKSLQRASAYWASLQASVNLNAWLTAQCLGSPSVFVESLPPLPPETLPRVMRELREVFKERKRDFSEKDAEAAAAATVACFLLCTCLLIQAEAGDALVGLPKVGERDAAHLLASLIALVMAGGRLELRAGDGVLPRGSGTHRVQSTGINAQFDFERQLFSELVKNQWSVSAGQKTGELSDDERKELLEELRELRRDGVRTGAMCIIIDGEASPMSGLGVAREIGIPVFHVHADVAHALVGVSEAALVTHLKLLWADVCSYQSPDAADVASP